MAGPKNPSSLSFDDDGLFGLKHWILDDNWNVIECPDLMTWARWFEHGHRVLAVDCDESDPNRTITVSTVFLGIDHGFGSDRPILWETLVFGGLLHDEMNRYATKEEALIGHQRMCERVRESLTKGHL